MYLINGKRDAEFLSYSDLWLIVHFETKLKTKASVVKPNQNCQVSLLLVSIIKFLG